MRRTILVSLFVLLLLSSVETAFAQTRDPFVPLVTEDTGGTVTTGDVVVGEAPEPALPTSERLANTGFPIAQFVGLALALMGSGAFLMTAVRSAKPSHG